MARPLWIVDVLKKLYPHRQWFAKMTRLPLIGKAVDHALFRDDEMFFLPRAQSIPVHSEIGQPESLVIPYQVVEHFINQANHHWVMNACLCREGDDCQDYPQTLGCIFLGEPVTQIHSELGRLVTREEALEHAQRCREAGLVHTIGRNRLDSIWLGAGPSEKLLTICNCCPCCCLWGIVPNVTPLIGDKITALPGVEVEVNANCTGCELCLEEGCFAEALEMVDGRMTVTAACRACGRCIEICPEGAITLSLNGRNSLEEVVERISRLVDLS